MVKLIVSSFFRITALVDRRKIVDIVRETESFNGIFTRHFNKQTLKNIISRGAKNQSGRIYQLGSSKVGPGPNNQIFSLPLGGWDRADVLNTHADPKRKEGASALVKGIRTALVNGVGGLENAGNSARTNAKLRSFRKINCTNMLQGITNGVIPQKGSETGLSHRLLRISQTPKCRG